MRIDKPTDEIACWWEETTISTQLRLAAGICVLTTGLLVGSAGGAIAAADPESTGSTSTQSQSANDPSQSVSPVTAPTTTATTASSAQPAKHPLRTTLQDVFQRLRSLGKPPPSPAPSTTDPVATGTASDSQAANVTPAATGSVAPDSTAVASDSKSTAPATTNTVAPVSTVGSESTVASDANVPPPPTGFAAPVAKVVAPVTNAVATVAGVALPVPGVVMSLPGSTTPVTDVITSVQEMLTTVNNAVAPLAQLLSDIYSLMGVAALNATVTYGGVNDAAGLASAAGAALPPPTSPLPAQVLPISGSAGAPLLGSVTAPAMLGGIAAVGLRQDLSLSGTAPPETAGAGPTTVLSLLEHTVRAVLAPASLSALAAIALPGLGGLLIICAAGMRVGYRQAKAALAVRSTGIARFARQGPIGIVRSGSLVALHPRPVAGRRSRPLRVVRPEVSPTAPLLEQVA
jgi:hypothetical protein